VLPVADAMILSRYADAVLLVVAAGQTRRTELRSAVEKLAQGGALVVGAVLNKATVQDGYGYYGGNRPYALPEDPSPDGPKPAQNGRHKQNGVTSPSGPQGRRGR
jgi:succinoglycan biosynthesis transport protein ExoP